MRRFFFFTLTVLALGSTVIHAAQPDNECGRIPNNPEASIKACTRIIEFGGLDRPELAKAYYVRAAEWAALGNHDRAIADFTSAIDLDPKLPGAHYSRALSLSEKNEHDRAIADYDVALKLAPRDPRAHVGRAFEWIVKGDYKRAIVDYEAVTRLESNSMSGYFGRGRARFYAGDFMGSASDFARAHQLEPSMYSAIWLYLARKRADIAGEKTLGIDARSSGEGSWPAPVVGLYLGRLTPEAVQSAATDLNVNKQRDQRCEANFYIAHWHLMRGAREPARRLFEEARSGCASSFLEYEGAVAELRRLQP